MGCNAWNHPADCDCGWGGDTGGGGGWHGGSAFPITTPAPPGRWGKYESARLESYTIPNARCPICSAEVFFYQSVHGGRVFFDPPLGPPWPKHPCTDNSYERGGAIKGGRTQPWSDEIPPERQSSRPKPERVISVMRRSGWHPLLDVKVRHLGRWQVVEGVDAVDNHRCQIITEGSFVEYVPTFIRIDEPGRITCGIEQVQGPEGSSIHIARGRGWFGVSSLEEARIAKAARSGEVGAMRSYAQSQSYRHIGRDNWTSDVAQFVDLKAALFWFAKAASGGSEEAKLERAYLLDLIDLDAAYRKWRRENPKLALRLAPAEIRTPAPGSLAHSVCLRAAERVSTLNTLINARKRFKHFVDDYYQEKMQPGQDYLEGIARRKYLPHLSAAILDFLKKTEVPPFRAE